MNHQIAYFQPQPTHQVSEHFYRTNLAGLFYFEIPKFNDQRGFFSQLAILPELDQVLGLHFEIKQVNLARSQAQVARGLHAEGWNKLVSVISGAIHSAIVDIRPNSPTFKQVEYFQLSYDQKNDTGNGLFISQGLANSVCVTQGPVNYLYLVDQLYQDRRPSDNWSLDMFDPALNLQWPIAKEEMLISERDLTAKKLAEMIS